MNKTEPSHQLPLQGIRVVEICTTIAGPACGRMLADFGADVIKIEPPDGDPIRQLGEHVGDVSLYAASILRGKRSVVINLKTEAGRDLAKELILKTDVVLENNRPGTLERFGLGYNDIAKIKPEIIYARITGYGQDGPNAHLPGYGAICEAFGGVRHMTGDPDRPPARVALATTDYLSAVYTAFGVLLALRSRDQGGKGQVVDVALYEAAFSQMESVVPAFDKLGSVPMRQGPNLPSMALNSLYPTAKGGYILIAASSNSTFERLANLMGRQDLLDNPDYATVRSRGEPSRSRVLDEIVSAWTANFEGVELEHMLHEAGIPSSRVFTIRDIFEDPHYAARQMLPKVPHPVLGEVRQMGTVPRLSDTPGRILHTGPELGADTRSVLAEELHLSEESIERLVEAKAIGIHS